MKIATWNVERPSKSSPKTVEIINILKSLNADIIVLTETNEFIDLGEEYKVYHTAALQDPMYKKGERRVSIFTRYPQPENVSFYETFNAETSICAHLDTPIGRLAVYGTIIGIYGNREKSFIADLEAQLNDIENVGSKVRSFCFIGDLNMSFADSYYFTQEGRIKLITAFDKSGLKNYTTNQPNNIDHIVLSKHFVGDRSVEWSDWNKEKKLSDHKGVMIEIVE